ncbi:hypothetical protein Tco_0230779, partial [Tanacetum coccineum]
MQRNVEYPRALLYGSIAQDMRMTTKRGVCKQRPAKKSKSDATTSTGGSSASAQFGELMEQELRLKREAAERAFEAQAEKDRTLMRLEGVFF